MINKLSLWIVRSITILGAILAVGGFLILGFLPPQSEGSDPVFIGEILFLGVGLVAVGLATLGLGELFQKMKHDEWSLGHYRFPHGPQVKCVRCGGLMNSDTRVCPFCGLEAIPEPLIWSPVDQSKTSKSTEAAPSSHDV